MSCLWGFYCETCQKQSETHFNHGQDILRELVRLRHALKAIPAPEHFAVTISNGQSLLNDLHAFLDEHECHTLGLINEHGELDTLDP